ncbi:MAG: 30S ribosome-binding factor RbfA [Actinomycetota bacterium]
MARNQRGEGRGGRRGGGGQARSRSARPQTNRHFPRTARLNTLLQEIVAGHLERVDDERLGFLTVTGVEVDNDLNRAEVFVSTFDDLAGPEAEAEVLEALGEYRKPIQAEIARQARIRKTPEVVFAFDPGVRAGARIEEILSGLDLPADDGQDREEQTTDQADPEVGSA